MDFLTQASISMRTVLGVLVLLIIVVVILKSYLKRSNPLLVSSALQVMIETVFEVFESLVEGILGSDEVKRFTPLAMTIFFSMFLSNSASLLGFSEGAKINPFYTLTWSFSMFIFWNIYAIYKVGIKKVVLGVTGTGWSILMFPLNLLGELIKPISMGLRLFGNITAGAVIMMLFWGVAEMLLPLASGFGAIGSVLMIGVGSAFTAYFSLFGPLIQALVFTVLTLVNIGLLIEENE